MKLIYRPSVVPIYAVAATWLVFGLVAPLDRVSRFLLCALLSFAAFLLCRLFFPGKTVEVEVPPDTGNEQTDKLIVQGRKAAARMRELNARILDAGMTRTLDQIEAVTGQILTHLERHPELESRLHTFLDYYLPTTCKLLESYVELQEQSVKGENIQATMARIRTMLDTVLAAFCKQLDALFESVNVDITADIQVLEQMLQANGL